MAWTGVILTVIGLAALLEGIFIVFLQDFTKKILSSIIKNPKKAKLIGAVEIVLALIILYSLFKGVFD